MSDPTLDYCRDWGLVTDIHGWKGAGTPYQQLELPDNAPIEECRAKFKTLALAYHPDKCLSCSKVQILESQLATEFTVYNDCKADF